jgi:hypothetical protein
MSLCPSITPRFHPLSAAMIEDALATKTCLEPASLKLLQSGAPEANLSSPLAGPLYFAIDVPQDVADFRVETTGGTGDADLYVQRRTLSVYASCRRPPPATTKRWCCRFRSRRDAGTSGSNPRPPRVTSPMCS